MMATNGARGKTAAPAKRAAEGPELDALIRELADSGLSVGEIGEQTGLAKSSVHDRIQRLRAAASEQEQVEQTLFRPQKDAKTFLQMLGHLPGVGGARLDLARTLLQTTPSIATDAHQTYMFLVRGLGLAEYTADLLVRGWHRDLFEKDPTLAGRLFPSANGPGWAAYAPAPPTPSDPLDQLVKMLGLMKGLRDFDGSTRPQGADLQLSQIYQLVGDLKGQLAESRAQMDMMKVVSERDSHWMKQMFERERTEADLRQKLAISQSSLSASDQVSLKVVESATAAFTKATDKSDQRMDRLERTVAPFLRGLATQGQGLGVPVPTSQAELSAIAGAGQPFEPTLEPGVTEPVEETLFPGPPLRRDGGGSA